jgi:hypothetical protein
MYPLDEYTLSQDYKLNELPAVLEKGRRHALLRDAGLIQRRSFSCQVCRSLWRFGHGLVAAGQWLERRYEHAALSPARG